MKIYEFGEQCEHEGILWSQLVIDSSQSFDMVKTAIVAKFELNVSLTAETTGKPLPKAQLLASLMCASSINEYGEYGEYGEYDDQNYINALLEQRKHDIARLEQARAAINAQDLESIEGIFIRHRDVAEYVGCDYWSLLAAKEIEKKTNI